MAIKEYRCITGVLNIRSEPRNSDQFKTGETLKRGERIRVDDATLTESEGFLWAKHSRGWSAVASLDGRFTFLTDALAPRAPLWGINIDPNNPRANPPAQSLTSVGWVRFVMHVDSRRQTLDQAFAFYDPYIQGYARSGIKILLILLHDTYVGNHPWIGGGDWGVYARGFGERAGLIARHYRGMVSAYQIGNENDVSGAETSLPITPQNYAMILMESVRNIRLSDPAALVVTGGLASPLNNALNYLRDIKTACGNVLPADGIGIHPYGQTPPDSESIPFPGWSQGSLDTYLTRFSEAFPGIPLWISEIGVPRVDVENRAFWPRIAAYMDKVVDFVRLNYPHAVAAITWFAWSDPMDRAGIVNADQQPKGSIYTSYFKNTHMAMPLHYNPFPTPHDGQIAITHTGGTSITDSGIDTLAQRIALTAPNVTSFVLKSSKGVNFLVGRAGAPGVGSAADLSLWANALSRYRIRLQVWHELVGTDLNREITLLTQISRANGVQSIILDLVPGTLALRDSAAIRNFMTALRRALPGGYPLGASFDGRPDQFGAVNLPEWFPFVESWHPRINFTALNADPIQMLRALYGAMRQLRKPILPLLQVGVGAVTRGAVRFATDGNGSAGVGFLNAVSPGDLSVVRAASLPWLAGYIPRRVQGTLKVAASTLRVRALPLPDAEVLESLKAGDRVEVLETRSIPPLEWVRHAKGWSAARSTATGEVFLV